MVEHDRKENQAQVGPGTEDEHRERNAHRKGLFHGAEITGDRVFAIQARQMRGQIDQQRNGPKKRGDTEKDLNRQKKSILVPDSFFHRVAKGAVTKNRMTLLLILLTHFLLASTQ